MPFWAQQVDTMQEFVGLTGWNRVAVIGMRRDDLRRAGARWPHKRSRLR